MGTKRKWIYLAGAEKNNDDAWEVVLRKSNNWVTKTDILQTDSRVWSLQSRKIKPR